MMMIRIRAVFSLGGKGATKEKEGGREGTCGEGAMRGFGRASHDVTSRVAPLRGMEVPVVSKDALPVTA